MVKFASAILIGAVVALLLFVGLAYSVPVRGEVDATIASSLQITDVSAQRRRPARIVVRPRQERFMSYPGPNAVRQCASWLQPENRPSGPVITPQMRCWWVRG